MLTAHVYDRKNKSLLHVKHDDLKKYVNNQDYVIWLDIEPVKEEDCAMLKQFGVHDLTIEDIKKFTALPKIDEFDEYLFLIFHRIYFDARKKELIVREIDFVLGKNFIISTHNHDFPSIKLMRKKVEASPNFMGQGPEFILHGIIDYFIDHYLPILSIWDDELDALEEDIFKGKHKHAARNLLAIKRHISDFKKSLAPQRDFIDKLSRADTPFISTKALAYFKDIADHIHRAYINLEAVRDIATSTFDAYVSIVNNKMAETSNRLNSIMHRLTVISTIFLPLTFITGLYGMNFTYMPEIAWHYGYFAVLGAIVIIVTFMLIYFKRTKMM